VLTNCASVDQTGKRLYYPAPTAAVLLEIFKSIGNDLTRIRLSQWRCPSSRASGLRESRRPRPGRSGYRAAKRANARASAS